MEGVGPDKLRLAPKRHLVNPQHEWLKNNLRDKIEEMFNDKKFKERGYFNHKNVLSNYEKFCKYGLDNSFVIWQCINTELWFREFIDQ